MTMQSKLDHLSAQVSNLSAQLAKESATLETLNAKLCENAVELMFAKQALAEATEKYDRSFDLYCTLRRGCGKMPCAPGTIF